MTLLFAQPYDTAALGFYFENFAEYKQKSKNLKNEYGQKVEEFELQMIEAEQIDLELFDALNIHQGNINAFFNIYKVWDYSQKVNVIIAVGEVGYNFDLSKGDPDDFDMDVYEMSNMRELAEYFINEGCFGEIPEDIANYIDYEAIARDLTIDFCDTRIDGRSYIYRCF